MSTTIASKFFVILNIPRLLVLSRNGIALGPGAEQEEHGAWRPSGMMSISRTGTASLCFGNKKGLLWEVAQLAALTARYMAKVLLTQDWGDQIISYFLNFE